VLPTPFAAMHGLPSPLAGPYNGVPPTGGLAGLGGFPLGAAGLGVRVQGNAQASAVLLVSNLNEEVSEEKVSSSSLILLLFVFAPLLHRTRDSKRARGRRSSARDDAREKGISRMDRRIGRRDLADLLVYPRHCGGPMLRATRPMPRAFFFLSFFLPSIEVARSTERRHDRSGSFPSAGRPCRFNSSSRERNACRGSFCGKPGSVT